SEGERESVSEFEVKRERERERERERVRQFEVKSEGEMYRRENLSMSVLGANMSAGGHLDTRGQIKREDTPTSCSSGCRKRLCKVKLHCIDCCHGNQKQSTCFLKSQTHTNANI
ncbi:unnamed protein product, partial [Boreogadus saida]